MPPTATLESTAPAEGAIDPRIRARRIEVRRVAGRRKLQRVVDLGLVLAVVGAFVGALWTPLLDVDEVRVDGAVHTGADVVRERSGIVRGSRLISVDLHSAGVRVAALPWVGDVAMRRRADGTVEIIVTERKPVALVGAGANAALVDRSGRLLGPAAGVPQADGLPVLSGVGTLPAIGAFLDPAQADVLALAQRVNELAPAAVASWSAPGLYAHLAQGGVVRFGDPSQLDAKLRSLRTVLDQVDLRCVAVVDLRLPGSPVLTREERCS